VVEDVGYALWKHLNLGLVDLRPAEQARRARLFTRAYGTDVSPVDAIELAQRLARQRFTQHGWTETVHALDDERTWLRDHRPLFEQA
jgi:hypothetical protein